MYKVVYIGICVLLMACGQPKQPVILLKQSDLSGGALVFKTDIQGWEAILYTPVQPVKLAAEQQTGLLKVSLPEAGITEGRAHIALSKSGTTYYYQVLIKNKSNGRTDDHHYISPKTVNPDSSLFQQRIITRIDARQQVVAIAKTQFFEESERQLSPKAAIVREQKGRALSAYYVQPGTCVNVPLSVQQIMGEEQLLITAGPLKDKWNNVIADGTEVILNYQKGAMQSRRTGAASRGYVRFEIEAAQGDQFKLWVNVDRVQSMVKEAIMQ